MANFKEQFRDWRTFWAEVWKMWLMEHGLTMGLLWKLSPFLTVISILGIIFLPQPWQTVAWVVLGIGLFDLLFTLCAVVPYQKYAKDKAVMQIEIEKRRPAYEIQVLQESNPNLFVSITPEEIYVTPDENNRKILSLKVKVTSLLFKPTKITRIDGQFSIPIDQIHNPLIQCQSRPLDTRSISELAAGISGRTAEITLDCKDNPYIPTSFTINNRVILLEGTAKIETGNNPDIRLDFQGYVTFKALRAP